MFRRFIALSTAIAMLASLVVPAAASHRGDPPPPPPEPVEINEVCLDRIHPGWKVGGECERPVETIVFDGTAHLFCFIQQNNDYDGILAGTVQHYGVDTGECATNATPVVLTGDNAVEVCIYPGNRIADRGSPLCEQDAVI